MKRTGLFGVKGTAALLLLLLSLSCGGGGGGGTEPEEQDAEGLTSSGWEEFENDDIDSAIDSFDSALVSDSAYGEALAGLGWAYARADSLAAALDAFNGAFAAGYDDADVHAGKAVVLRDLTPPDYQGAIAAAESALSLEPRYLFDHDPSFDWRDLRLILAQSDFALALYNGANAEVDSLGGNPAIPGTDTFLEDLLDEIDRLSG